MGRAVSSTARTVRPARTRVTPRAAILLTITVAVLVYAMVPLRIYVQQRAQLRILHRQERVLQGRTASLTTQVHQLRDPARLELIARECLGMVRPGEISFVVVPSTGRPAVPRC
jgi:cell division protein FtsB